MGLRLAACGLRLPAVLAAAMLAACTKGGSSQPSAPPQTVDQLPGHGGIAQDTSQKEDPRLMPAEATIRTYLQLFGGLSPIAAQRGLRASDGSALFDAWTDYLSALGVPDYKSDLPRGTQVNALMVATFERIGVALCDRALELDLKAATPKPAAQRLIYTFDLPAAMTPDAFTSRFDQMHRTFLGYPAALAPTDRTQRFYQLYQDTVARHTAAGAPASRFTPAQSGWAAVCYGLMRHPEFHLY